MTEKSHEAKGGAPKRPKSTSAKGARADKAPTALPTVAQLDERDWHKAGPRRQAGPPLASGPGPAAASLSAKEPPPPTDPK